MRNKISDWKDLILLIMSLSIANIGDFIYLITINIIVYQMTNSAAAVAGLWIVGPLINILTKAWTGSYIDYRKKKKIIIITYAVRAGLIMLIPFAPSIIYIYVLLVFLSITKSFFEPSSMTYTTMLVPKEKRKLFNSIRSFTSSGAFIIGPALGGGLILLTSVDVTLWINAFFFIVAGMLLMRLPDKEKIKSSEIRKLNISQVIEDFSIVKKFLIANRYFSFIYLTFIFVMIITFAMDAQEVVFTQRVIGLSEFDYSLLISITGIGSVISAVILSVMTNKISIRFMIVAGLLMMTVGYLIYAFSWSFASITVGFITLGFFHVFLSAGITTFYQNNVPIEIMGRVTSIFQLIQSCLQVIFILAVGFTAELISLRITIISLSLVMLAFSLLFAVVTLNPSKRELYDKESVKDVQKMA